MPQTNSFSVYLIKEGYVSLKSIVISGVKGPIEIEGGELYYKTTEKEKNLPTWVTGFFGEELDETVKKQFTIRTVSAVYLIKLSIGGKDVIFALTFGFGRFLIKSECIKRDFGLDTSKHAVQVEHIKQICTLSFDNVIKSKTLESIAEIKESEFFLDNDTDVLKSVNGRVRDIDEAGLISGRMIGGKDSVNMTAKVDIKNLKDFLEQLYNQYLYEGEEGIRFSGNITRVNDDTELLLVDSLLFTILKSEIREKRIWLSLPLGDTDQNAAYKEYVIADKKYPDLSLDILNGVESVDSIKKTLLKAIPLESEKQEKEYSLYDCLYAEFEDERGSFVLAEGCVYKVDKSYKSKVDKFYDDFKDVVSLPFLSDWNDEDEEGNFNTGQVIETVLVMDKKLVYPEGRSRFELCDLLTNDGNLIHVKIFNGASHSLGHLFNQGLVSARCVADKSIIEKINEKISSVKNDDKPDSTIDFKLDSKRPITITFLVLCKNEKYIEEETGRPIIPFFAKAVFMDVCNSIRRLGENFTVNISGMTSRADKS